MNLQTRLDLSKIAEVKSLKDKDPKFRCFYCSSSISMEDLKKVDRKLKKMDSEIQEFLQDLLPDSNLPREKPYTHLSDLGYEVLNICPKCFRNAKNELEAE